MRLNTVVIIGAGFSGAAVAAQLIRRATTPLRVVLVNKSGRMARGLAYGTRSPDHLLNVPAGNMSALPDEPENFLHYCQWADSSVRPHSFVPRALYGAYLDALLNTGESRDGAMLERMVGQALDISQDESHVTVTLDGNRQIFCDEVVLAFGHFSPNHVLPKSEFDELGPRYIADPWSVDLQARLPRTGRILLVGSGLTALDVLISLRRQGYEGQITCLSRRGLTPLGHRPEGAKPDTVDGAALAASMGQSLRQQVRVLRAATRAAMARGEDWRDVIGALRRHTPSLWRTLTFADRRRFLRHVRPYWEVLRHRCAPAAQEVVRELKEFGRLRYLAGRLCSARLNPVEGTVEATFRLRGDTRTVTEQFGFVVNCTGPGSNVLRSGEPLLERLMAKQQLCPDPLGLGLVVDEHYAVLDVKAQAQPWLYYIGPLLKARDWESTAVPELREHAQRLAKCLLAKHSGRADMQPGDARTLG
ncbi:FAD/NAD(P)-binding protein [Paraburkholderia sp. A3RO-2L]|uniref:FAD/NAD(P)-binding protein n=1 Tax=Paraburkholderia sp. A3RO-2L TaxID=3028376 RepID=UPI003DA7CB40